MSRRMVKVLGGILLVTAVVGTVVVWTRRSRSFGGWHECAPEGSEATQPPHTHTHTQAEAEALDLARTAMNDVATSAGDLDREGLDSEPERTDPDRRSDLIGSRRAF